MYAVPRFAMSWSGSARVFIAPHANTKCLAAKSEACADHVPALATMLAATSLAFAQAAPDWKQLDAEALADFQTYLRFDTSNPPDKTADAIAFLKNILNKEGIEAQVFVSKPGMANLVAKLPGPAGVKPLLLMSHADVVPAVAKDWGHAPFSGDLD